MEKENLSLYEDGKMIGESEIATAVAKVGNAVVYQNDAKDTFFLVADPDSIDIGTIALEKELMPVEEADDSLREKIDDAVRGL